MTLTAPSGLTGRKPNIRTIDIDAVMWRVHKATRPALNFRKVAANRFDDAAKAFETLYVSLSAFGSLSETLLHDVLNGGPPIDMESNEFDQYLISQMRCKISADLIDLSGSGHTKLGVTAEIYTETGSPKYAITQQWARALYEEYPHIHGICYPARHMSSETSIVWFERAKANLNVTSSVAIPTDLRVSFTAIAGINLIP